MGNAVSTARRRRSVGVFAVVVSYAFFAGLWILLSDRVLAALFTDPVALVQASVLKGGFFVAVTSVLLYILVKRLVAQIDEGHRRELAHQRAQEQAPPMLVAIAEASSDAIVAKDVDGRFLLFNNAAARLVGKAAGDVLGKNEHQIFPADLAEKLSATRCRIVATGHLETTEEVLQTVDGDRTFLSVQGPLRDAHGRIFGTYGISHDITERKRAEERLRRLAEDMQATLQAIPDLLFELDSEGCCLDVKTANESLLAIPAAQLLGRTVSDILPPEAAATVMAALAAARQNGTDCGRTIMLRVASGAHWFELSVARKPVVDGQTDRLIVLSRDITSRKAVETELQQRNQELERFNRAAIEREVRMIALKREVNALAHAAGLPAAYDTSFADPPEARDAP